MSTSDTANADILAYVGYTRTMSATDLLNGEEALETQFDNPDQYDSMIIQDGDSSASGRGATYNYTSLRAALPFLKRPAKAYVQAITGYTVANTLVNAPVAMAQYCNAAAVGTAAQRPIYDLVDGPNDVRAGTAVSVIEADINAIFADTVAACPDISNIMTTAWVQNDILNGPTELAELQALNNWVLAGDSTAKYLENIWADPVLGQGNYTTSAFGAAGTTTLYTVGNEHPSDQGMEILGNIKANVINSIP